MKTLTKKILKTNLVCLSFCVINAYAATDNYPITIESCDRKVTFEQAPTRAVSNDVNLTEMLLALGLRDSMVGYSGVSGWKNLSPSLVANIGELPQLSEKYPTREVLLNADVDFYFAGWNYGFKVGGDVTPLSLNKFGIKSYELSESCIHIMSRKKVTLEDVYHDLRNLGKIFAVSERAETLISGYKLELQTALAKAPDRNKPLRVFVYDSGEDKPFSAGKYAMPTALIEAAGGVNIMDDIEQSWVKVGWESVVERNPEVIVIINYGDVTAEQKIAFMKNNPAFKDIEAVKNNRFVVLQYDEATPGPRNIAAIKKLLKNF
ncbi:MAG: ABC transporter substrate-binding protein [Osedax symbiont Rs1]|nr:MAG: ABC transporter substrate-binding protein [Osedax symbiont Rs1]